MVGIPQVLTPLETVPYCWDAPSRVLGDKLTARVNLVLTHGLQKHELTVELTNTTFVHSYNLDQIKFHKERKAMLLNAAPLADGQAQEIAIQAEVRIAPDDFVFRPLK